ncbi:hypothetical protein ACFWQ1_25790 [Streptomyces albidoflavus]
MSKRSDPEAGTVPCPTCRALARGEAAARAEYDWSRATDCRVLLRRHHLADHQGRS